MASVAVIRIGHSAFRDGVVELLIDRGAADIDIVGDAVFGLFPCDEPTLLRALHDVFEARAWQACYTVEPAQLLDWGSVWVRSVRPVRFGPVWLVPVGSEQPETGMRIELERCGAFGTGLHPTTSLCLERLVERPCAGAVLDFGTGSGVLALMALRLGASTAVGVDIDATALGAAERNALRNDLLDRLRLGTSLPSSMRFSFLVANVLADPLREAAFTLVSALDHGGEASLSGFTEAQAPAVARVFQRLGCRVLGQAVRNGWCRLDLLAPW